MVCSLPPNIVPTRIISDLERLVREGGEAVVQAVATFLDLALTTITSSAPTCPGDLLDRETSLHHRTARECLDPIFGKLLEKAHDCASLVDEATQVAREVGFTPQRALVPVQVLMLGGSVVTLYTPYYLQRRPRQRGPGRPGKRVRGKPGNGVYPILARLGIHFRVTPALGSEVARLVAQGTEREAIENLAVRGVNLKLKVVQRLAGDLARRALNYRDFLQKRGQQDIVHLKGKRIAIAVDGGRIRIRETNRRGRRLKSRRRGFKAEWREPKLFVVYELDVNGRRKQRGVVRYDVTLGDADRIFDLLEELLRELGAQEAEEWVFLGDGAPWLWNRFPGLASKLGFDESKVTQIVDFYHAAEHLQKIADAVKGWTIASRRNWILKNKKWLKMGRIEKLLANCELLCKGRNAKKVRKLLAYFNEHADRMRYGMFQEKKLPIGSGAVESGVRRVVNLRFKGNGIFWNRATAEGLLHLRAQLLSGRWYAFTKALLEPSARW